LSEPIDHSTFFLSGVTGSNGFLVWASLYVKDFFSGPQASWPTDFSPDFVVVMVHSMPSAMFEDAVGVLVR
jgi:hypothetical protein